ncbi:MAG: NUDIX domain-containing protein [Sedimenticola sp.]|nr:NUDIX domain-containing protein [Sedimenticola sp.]
MSETKLSARIIDSNTVYQGFYRLQRLTLEHDRFDGETAGPLVREVLQRSDVVAALLHDPASDRVVMVEQYRPGPHLAGEYPWLTDIVAGRIEAGQTPLEAIQREIVEESGLAPGSIQPIGTYFTAPHISSEKVHLFLATVNADAVAGSHGLAHEGEDIRPRVFGRRELLELAKQQPLSLWAGLALSWFEAGNAK